MKRLELFEFEDFPWLPRVIRTGVTHLIAVLHKWVDTAGVISALIIDLKNKHGFTQITDLGSGSGGPMLDVIDQINKTHPDKPVQLTLTDLHPHPQFVNDINQRAKPHVSYHPEPVDASQLGDAPPGLKTMIASFHHMNPDTARQILTSAQENRTPILIYEIAKNNIPVFLWVLLLPISLVILFIMTWIMTPFIRPLSWRQLVFTYLIPVIPLVYAWDGQASLMRTYTFDDIQNCLIPSHHPDYEWDIFDAKNAKGRKQGYVIIGQPLSKNMAGNL